MNPKKGPKIKRSKWHNYTLYIPLEMVKKLKERANKEKTSINGLVHKFLSPICIEGKEIDPLLINANFKKDGDLEALKTLNLKEEFFEKLVDLKETYNIYSMAQIIRHYVEEGLKENSPVCSNCLDSGKMNMGMNPSDDPCPCSVSPGPLQNQEGPLILEDLKPTNHLDLKKAAYIAGLTLGPIGQSIFINQIIEKTNNKKEIIIMSNYEEAWKYLYASLEALSKKKGDNHEIELKSIMGEMLYIEKHFDKTLTPKARAIGDIEELYPPDCIYPDTVAVGKTLLHEAIDQELSSWRDLPEAVLTQFAGLCRQYYEKETGGEED